MVLKIAALALHPLPLFFELAVLAILLQVKRRPRAARALLGLDLTLLFLASLPIVAARLVGRIEAIHPPVAVADSPRADAIVVLGGAVGSKLPPRLDVELVDASDRVLHA